MPLVYNEEDVCQRLAEFFKVMGDRTRLRIVKSLLDGELQAGLIAEAVSMEQSAVSHQLRILKSARLVRARREGKAVFYSLDDDHVESVFRQGMDHIMEQ